MLFLPAGTRSETLQGPLKAGTWPLLVLEVSHEKSESTKLPHNE